MDTGGRPACHCRRMVASNFSAQQEEQYRGFTSEAAIIVTYGLGAAIWLGYATLAVMLAITTTVLLYFKAELRQFSERMTPKDINSILQFAVLSLVILPVLPNLDYGPYNAFNPRQIWWMVVLISGLALSGYLALRIIGARTAQRCLASSVVWPQAPPQP